MILYSALQSVFERNPNNLRTTTFLNLILVHVEHVSLLLIHTYDPHLSEYDVLVQCYLVGSNIPSTFVFLPGAHRTNEDILSAQTANQA